MTHPTMPPSQPSTYESITQDALWRSPDGTVLYKPEMNGWTLFLRERGEWVVVDAYDRSNRGQRYSPGAVGMFSPGYVVHRAPTIGYYTPPADGAS